MVPRGLRDFVFFVKAAILGIRTFGQHTGSYIVHLCISADGYASILRTTHSRNTSHSVWRYRKANHPHVYVQTQPETEQAGPKRFLRSSRRIRACWDYWVMLGCRDSLQTFVFKRARCVAAVFWWRTYFVCVHTQNHCILDFCPTWSHPEAFRCKSLGDGYWPGEVLLDKEMEFYKALGGGEASFCAQVRNSKR